MVKLSNASEPETAVSQANSSEPENGHPVRFQRDPRHASTDALTDGWDLGRKIPCLFASTTGFQLIRVQLIGQFDFRSVSQRVFQVARC